MFCQITADEERRVSRRIVVVQHASLVSHNSGLFLRTASLKRVKTSWYNCLPSDHVVQIHDGQGLSNQKTQPTSPWSLTDSSVLWSRRPFPHPLRRLHLGFNIIPIIPRLISCYYVLKKFLIAICIGKQFLTDFNTVRHSALSVLVGALFKKFGLYLNTPRILLSGLLIVGNW